MHATLPPRIGITRETMSGPLSDQAQGVLEVKGSTILILRKPDLEKLVTTSASVEHEHIATPFARDWQRKRC